MIKPSEFIHPEDAAALRQLPMEVSSVRIAVLKMRNQQNSVADAANLYN